MLTSAVVQDPLIRKRKLQLLGYFSTTALHKNTGIMLKVLEHILMTWPALEPEHRAFNDAVKDLQGESMMELQRMAAEVPDHLLVSLTLLSFQNSANAAHPQNVYDQIEARVSEMMASGALDEKRTLAYKSFLFLIMYAP